MANNKEEAGKGTPRPGETPGSKRTYATIDLTASEVPGRDRPATTGATAASASAAAEAKSGDKPSEPQFKSTDPSRPGAAEDPKAAGAGGSIATPLLATPW